MSADRNAKAEVVEAISRGYFRVVEAAGNTASIAGLAPILSDFFSSYETLETEDGILKISHEFQEGPVPNSIRIGRQDYIDIVVSRGRDVVYVLSGGERALEEAEQYPSIWEFLVGEIDQ